MIVSSLLPVNPIVVTTSDIQQAISNLKTNTENINDYGFGRNQSFWTDSRINLNTTLKSVRGANQYIGVISAVSPGPITVTLPLPTDLTVMQGFMIYDESQNSNTYNITIACSGTAKIYGKGYSSSGVASCIINVNGGLIWLLYVVADKFMVINQNF